MLGFLAALKGPGVGEALSGIFGSVSMASWICLLIPQLIANYKAKSADALSMKFLFIWLAGDILNLSGAFFTTLAPSTIALGCYFCLNDLILISQCTYYNTLNARLRARREQHQHHHHHHHPRRDPSVSGADPSTSSGVLSPSPMPTEQDPLLGSTSHQHPHHPRKHRDSGLSGDPLARIITGSGEDGDATDGNSWVWNVICLAAVWIMGVAVWFGTKGAWGSSSNGTDEDGGLVGGEPEPVRMVGLVLGYGSAVLYLCARIPQIIKNYREKSCEGLALLFFLLSLTGNFTYGASVLAYSQEKNYLLRALPWLLGSLGTIVEDSIIFVQFRIYSPKRQAKKTGGTV